MIDIRLKIVNSLLSKTKRFEKYLLVKQQDISNKSITLSDYDKDRQYPDKVRLRTGLYGKVEVFHHIPEIPSNIIGPRI